MVLILAVTLSLLFHSWRSLSFSGTLPKHRNAISIQTRCPGTSLAENHVLQPLASRVTPCLELGRRLHQLTLQPLCCPGEKLGGIVALTFPITNTIGTTAGNGTVTVCAQQGTEGEMQINWITGNKKSGELFIQGGHFWGKENKRVLLMVQKHAM